MCRWLAILLLTFPLVAWAGGNHLNRYVQGQDYQRIRPRPALPVNAPKGMIQVAELFWYQCPHCARLEPRLQHWLHHDKPASVEFIRIPAVLEPNWLFMARVYYTARLLGDEKSMTPLLFNAIKARGASVEDLEGVARLFAQHGISQHRFRSAFKSLAVATRVRQAIQLTHEYGISGVPTLIVDGRYRVDPNQAGSYARMFRIVDYLVHKIKDQRRVTRISSVPGA